METLRVCIDARFVSGEYGGVEQFVIGLASGLSKLIDKSEEYLFLTYSDSQDWIKPYLGGPCRILVDTKISRESNNVSYLKQHLPGLIKLWHSVNPMLFHKSISQVKSNGIIENAGIDVMHFTGQSAFITKIPSIYHPHDLQHIHLPEYYTLRTRVLIDQMFRTFCDQASVVAVASDWVKKDLIQQYKLTEEIEESFHTLLLLVNILNQNQKIWWIFKRSILYLKNSFYRTYLAAKNHTGRFKTLADLRDKMDTNVLQCFQEGKLNSFRKLRNMWVNINWRIRLLFWDL